MGPGAPNSKLSGMPLTVATVIKPAAAHGAVSASPSGILNLMPPNPLLAACEMMFMGGPMVSSNSNSNVNEFENTAPSLPEKSNVRPLIVSVASMIGLGPPESEPEPPSQLQKPSVTHVAV